MADSGLGTRWRHITRVLKGEVQVTVAALAALNRLLGYTDRALRASGYDPAVLSSTAAGWRSIVEGELVPPIESVFVAAFNAAARGGLDAQDHGTRHIEAVWSRLVGVPDEVFDTMRTAIETGRRDGESIPQIAARIDGLLVDQERWTNRATVIARTEVIGANNSGGYSAARAMSDFLGTEGGLVVKEWLSTSDGRTRPTHAAADGQQVRGMDTPFSVGGADLQFAGDPTGPAEETVQCRCTVLYRYPGDPEYPVELSSGGQSTGNAPIPVDPVGADGVAMANTPGLVPVAGEPAAAVDAGPQNDTERMARALTLGELVMETKRGSTKARAAARAELSRRGIIAAGEKVLMAEDSENRNGVVLVALPASDDPVQGIGPEDKHATVLYFGDLPGSDGDNPNELLTEDFRTLLSSVAATVSGQFGPFDESVTGVESLGDDGARVWMLAGDSLPEVRSGLLDDTEISTVLNGVEQYPSFTPHVTVGYPEGDGDPGSTPVGEETDEGPEAGDLLDPETEAAAAAVKSITFDRLALWWGTDRTEWPLAAAVEVDPDAPADEPVVTAAAGEPAPATLDAGDPAPVLAPGADGSLSDRFHGVMMVEDRQTGDGRVFAANSVEWEGLLPFPIGWQVADAPGHDDAVIVGRFDSIEREGNRIKYEGTWDLDGYGWEPRRMVEGKFLRGLSVDVDDVEAIVVTQDGEPVDGMDLMFDDTEAVYVIQRGRIRSAALCRVPALAPLDGPDSVFIANGTWADADAVAPVGAEETPEDTEAPAPDGEAVTAALVAAAARANHPARTVPNADWFSDPGFGATAADDPRLVELPDRPGQYAAPFTVTDDGRVFGHLAAWGTCHIGIEGQCVTPPESLAAYAYFLTGETETSAGRVPTGSFTMDTGHADLSLRARPAAAHYDNTGTAFCDVATGEDAHGIWYSGALRPNVTSEQREALRAAGALSGDWRRIGAGLELVAGLAVNVPGFPIPRLSVAASGASQTALVAAGMVPKPVVAPNELGALVAAAVRRALAVERATARMNLATERARSRRVATLTARMERNR